MEEIQEPREPETVYSKASYFSMFFIVIGLLFGVVTILQLVTAKISYLVAGVSPEELFISEGALSTKEYVLLMSTLFFLSVGSFVGTSVIFFRIYKIDINAHIGLDRKLHLKQLLLVIVLGLAAIPLISFLAEYNHTWNIQGFSEELQKTFEALQKESVAQGKLIEVDNIGYLLVNLLVFALAPALCEELFFRGVLLPVIHGATGNRHIGIFASAFLFSIIHLQFFNFLPIMLMGVIFGYLYTWSGSLILPVLGHFINNMFTITCAYLYTVTGNKMLSIDYAFPTWTAIPSAIIAGAILYFFYKKYREEKISAE